MSVSCTLGGLNINDGVNYRLLYPLDFGEKLKTYDERRSYSGQVKQTNVTEANLITMNLPMRVYGSSAANLAANIAALNAKLDLAANDLVFDGTTYHCVQSPRVNAPRDFGYVVLLRATINLVLIRTPY